MNRDQVGRTDAFAMLLTAGTCMGLESIAIGFALGLATTLCLRLGPFRIEEPEGGKNAFRPTHANPDAGHWAESSNPRFQDSRNPDHYPINEDVR